MTTLVGATSPLQIARSALEPAMEPLMPAPLRHRATVMRQHHHLGRRHQHLEVAANTEQTVAIAAMTTLVGAISLLRTAKFAPEPSMPVPQRRRAVVMRQPQCRLLQHPRRRLRHHQSRRHRQDQYLASAVGVVVQAAPIQMIGATRTMRIATHALGNGALCRRNLFSSVQSADPLHDLLPDGDCIQSSEWIADDVNQDWFRTLFTWLQDFN